MDRLTAFGLFAVTPMLVFYAMLRCVCYVIVAAAFTAVMYGDDITIPLEDGNIVIKDAAFVRSPRTYYLRDSVPQLSFTILNNTSDGWDLKLRLDITSLCNDGKGEAHQSSRTVQISLPPGASQLYSQDYLPVVSREIPECVLTKMDVSLVSAQNRKLRINGATGERIDLEKEAEAQAKKDAIESARQKRLAAEQKKKGAELDAKNAKEKAERDDCTATYQHTIDKNVKDLTDSEVIQVMACQALGLYPRSARQKRLAAEQLAAINAKIKAERDAKDAEEKRTLRANCTAIYQHTIDKKVKDLTVREEGQVRACQALGLYPP
jgi:hypothetical protein